MVVYLGRVVELAEANSLCASPKHPYTQALISAVPIPDPVIERNRKRVKLSGDLESPLDPTAALRFLPGKIASGELEYVPQLLEVAPGHFVAEFE